MSVHTVIKDGKKFFWARADEGSEVLEPEKVKGGPLCMASYKYMYVNLLIWIRSLTRA